MTTNEEHEAAYARQDRPSADRGTVALVVLRIGGGEHECPSSAELSVDDGVVGDRWSHVDDPHRLAQVTLMMTGVAKTVAGDKPLHLPGDNFLVDIDLSDANVPAGTRIRVGSALLEVTPEPHTGCAKFTARLGSPALRWVNGKENRGRGLRGVNCRIVESGVAGVGDEVRVLR